METWETICAFLETLPGTQQDPPGGREVVRVNGKVIAFPAANERSRPPEFAADEAFVVIKVDKFERMALLHDDPQTFFCHASLRILPWSDCSSPHGGHGAVARVADRGMEDGLAEAGGEGVGGEVVKEMENS